MNRSILLAVLFIPIHAAAENWPQFRGPNGTGETATATLPTTWAPDKNVAWKTKLPGSGWSQPVVVGEKIFVTAAVADKLRRPKNFFAGVVDPSTTFAGKQAPPNFEIDWQVIALNRTDGKILWANSATKGRPKYPVHASNTYATETPCADNERVVAYYGATGTAVAFDHAGSELWKAELGAHPYVQGFGSGSSPALSDGKLFIQCFSEETAFVVALDAKNGKELWRLNWAEKGVTAWSSPIVWKNAKRTELVVCGPGRVAGLDMQTGKELWRFAGFETFASSPTADDSMLYFGNGGEGSSGPLIGIKAGAVGDITSKKGEKTNEFVAWNLLGAGTGWCSPVASRGFLYVPGNGVMTCYDSNTGKQLYKTRLPKMRIIVACPVTAGNSVLFLDEAGTAAVIQTGPKFEILGTAKLDDTFWSSPALVDNELFLRGVEYLYCVRPNQLK